MKTLLRSSIIADPTDNSDAHLENFRLLDASGLGFDQPEDVSIWTFVRDFVLQHHHPEIGTIHAHFERTNDLAVVDRVMAMRVLRPRSRGDFKLHLEAKAEDRRKVLVGKLLQEASEIVSKGIEVKGDKKGEKKILLGPVHAVRYLLDNAHGIVTPTVGSRLSGNVTGDGDDFLKEYDRVKNDPLAGVGQFVGLEQMDQALGGAKRNELWTHAAFTGGMKSSLMLNWAYNQAVYYQHDVLIFSLEMPYNQCRRLVYAMHSNHEKFARIHPPLDYQKVRDGQLSPKEEWFLREHLVPDFNDPKNGYGAIQIEVADPEKTDFTVADMRHRAETLYSKIPFSLMFVDHALLVAPRHWVPSTTERTNEVIRDCKKLAMGFNKGMGLAVVLLFQINREGYKAALKARQGGDGKAKSNNVYNLTHLSYSNECCLEGTFLRTRRGSLPIEQVVVGDAVWSSTGWKPVLATFDQGVRPTWDVVTDRGSSLQVTGEHQIRVLRDEKIDWTSVSQLKVGDWVIGTRGGDGWPTRPPSLPVLTFGPYEKPCGQQGVPLRVPVTLNDDVAYLLGAWDGDGKDTERGIGFTGNRKEIVLRDRIRCTFSRVFGHDIPMQESASRSGSFDLLKWSQPLSRWLADIAGPRGEVVPSVILRAPREIVLSYLRGLWDTDGWITNQNLVGIKMKSRKFLSQVQYLLTMLGYDSMLEPADTYLQVTNKTYEGWVLRLREWDGRAQFKSEIGFTEPWKARRLATAVAKKPSGKASDQSYPVGQTFRTVCARHTPYSLITSGRLQQYHYNNQWKAKKTGCVSRGAIEYLLTFLDEEGIEDTDAEFLRGLIALHVVRIASVGSTGNSGRVYDIEVNGDHEYASGPLLSHNCERSSDIVTSSWIDEELAKDNQVLFQCLKSRDQKPFEPFLAQVYWQTRRLKTLKDPHVQDVSKIGEEIDLGKDI